MKWFCFLLLALLLPSALVAQDLVISRSEGRITFKVTSVENGRQPFPKTGYKEAIEHRLGTPIEGMPLQYLNDSLIPVDVNAFVAAIHLSYARHYPLIISPDMIWMLICQGVSAHINAKSDSLRPLLVNHTGALKLQFSRPEFTKGDLKNQWQGVFTEISDSMKGYMKTDVYKQFIHSFSTTGPVEKSAFEIAFLESMKTYFEIELNIACGIPEITLEGTPDDWKWIRNNTAFLNQYGLEDWVEAMNPVLDQFVNASEGKIDSVFWKSFYFWESGCGTFINGWVCVFFPYDNEGVYCKKMMQADPNNRILAPFGLPSGISHVPFTMISNHSDTFQMEFVSGFMGVRQDNKNLAVRPEISFAIRDVSPSDTIFASVSRQNIVTKVNPDEVKNLFKTIIDTLHPEDQLYYDLDHFALDARFFSNKKTVDDYSFLSQYNIQPPLAFLDSGLNMIENIDSLSNFVNKRLNNNNGSREIEISMNINRFGLISNVYFFQEKDALTEKINTILKNITVVSPASVEGIPVTTIIKTTLIIK